MSGGCQARKTGLNGLKTAYNDPETHLRIVELQLRRVENICVLLKNVFSRNDTQAAASVGRLVS